MCVLETILPKNYLPIGFRKVLLLVILEQGDPQEGTV